MGWFKQTDWWAVDWVTPAIHVYALIVLGLTVAVYVLHRARLRELTRRVGAITARIEGRSPQSVAVRLDQLTGLLLHLGDLVERRGDLDIGPILEFVRHEERERGMRLAPTLVNVTETMIELFPMLGIFGTVYGLSGVRTEDFSSQRLLHLFGIATGTTLWALLYVIVFRIAYAAFVEGKVVALADANERFQEFLTVLEKRSRAAEWNPDHGPAGGRRGG